MAALFLTFEGPDGGGKTTQIARLAERLTALGHVVARTREPGGDPVGERVRELLLRTEVSPEAELLLFAAARAQNVQTVIRPALAAGEIVLCDRFTDSTIAYQGWGRGLPLEMIARLNSFATGGLSPDKTFLLDLPPEQGLARQQASEQDRLDRETLAFHERVRAGFLASAASEPDRFVVLDATRPADQVHEALWAVARILLTPSSADPAR
ncbi:MAG: dTMP kinase [Cytophagales bacterium]|nr:dTMP kinase [Armatimonadota bacterium]